MKVPHTTRGDFLQQLLLPLFSYVDCGDTKSATFHVAKRAAPEGTPIGSTFHLRQVHLSPVRP